MTELHQFQHLSLAANEVQKLHTDAAEKNNSEKWDLPIIEQ